VIIVVCFADAVVLIRNTGTTIVVIDVFAILAPELIVRCSVSKRAISARGCRVVPVFRIERCGIGKGV
jgi:hypothetical protein